MAYDQRSSALLLSLIKHRATTITHFVHRYMILKLHGIIYLQIIAAKVLVQTVSLQRLH